MEEKKYKLLKDLPDLKAGAIFTRDYNGVWTAHIKSGHLNSQDREYVFCDIYMFNTSEWFEELPLEERQETCYSLKQLYQFVTEYSREAREEGFDEMVGDFVDWIVSRDEEKKEYAFDSLLGHTMDNQPYTHTFTIQNAGDEPCDCEISVNQDGVVEKIFCEKHSKIGHIQAQEDKPVLPEKHNEPVGAMRFPKTVMVSEKDCYVVLAEDGERMQDQINQIIDYMKEKNL